VIRFLTAYVRNEAGEYGAGGKYLPEHVLRLRDGLRRYVTWPHQFAVFTDCDALAAQGLECIPVDARTTPGWWSKLRFFDPLQRGPGRAIFLDLDTVVLRDLLPILAFEGAFGIPANFMRGRLPAASKWGSCRFGSCVISLAPGVGAEVWDHFYREAAHWQVLHRQLGDQRVIEILADGRLHATELQDVIPPGYLLHYRDLRPERDPRAGLVVFGGRQHPGNCDAPWVREAWGAGP
jgi:hypothetical protein